MIIEWPLNGLFHDLVIIIIMSPMAISEMVDDNDDDEPTLVTQK